MRIQFTSSEISEWLDILDRLCDPCTDEDVKDYQKIVKKLENAEIRSWASRSKIRHIHEAERQKRNEHDDEVRKEVLEQYSKSRVK